MIPPDTSETQAPAPPSATRTNSIQVVLADDQPMARLGTRHLLASHSGIEVVAEAESTAEALRQVQVHRPDILVTEMELPDGLGTDVADALEEMGALTPVLILSAYRGRDHLAAFLDSNAVGYLLKHDDPAFFVEAIRGIREGRCGWFSRRVASQLLALRRHELDGNGRSSLTKRENKLLTVLARGCSNREIASELDLSIGTVKNYLTGIYKKLEVSGREKAIIWAYRHGLAG
jgi:DNA-binding NarL/FixJ family response regulator